MVNEVFEDLGVSLPQQIHSRESFYTRKELCAFHGSHTRAFHTHGNCRGVQCEEDDDRAFLF